MPRRISSNVESLDILSFKSIIVENFLMSGINTEIIHKGESFHVQTQDKGIEAHYVESLIYKSGRLLSTRRAFYTAYLGLPDLTEKIKKIIDDQHNEILKNITDGKFDHL